MSELLREEEISLDKLMGIFKAAFFTAELDSDGDLVIRDSGVNTFMKVDDDRKILTMFSLWGLKSSFSDADKWQLANRLNDELIVVRFAVPRPDTLWCDYQMLYEGGLSAFQIVNTYKRFVSVCRGACEKDEADIIGSD